MRRTVSYVCSTVCQEFFHYKPETMWRHFSRFKWYKVLQKNERKGYKLNSFWYQTFDDVCKIGLKSNSYIIFLLLSINNRLTGP